MSLEQRKRMFTSLIIINRRKLDIEIPDKLINYFDNLKYSIKNHNIDNIDTYKLNNNNYDNDIIKLYNNQVSNIDDILHETTNLENLKTPKEYKNILSNNFISIRVKRDVINNLFYVIKYEKSKRKIFIISNKYEYNVLKKILSIFDLFDIITKKENSYKLQVYLSDEEKKLNYNIDYLGPDNINSGSTYPGYNITLWRREEIYKVLIHIAFYYQGVEF